MDAIIISELEVFYHVGVTEAERANPQRLLISIDLLVDFRKAAQTDRLGETVDYNQVCQRLLRFGDDRQWNLVETLAVDIADMLLEELSARAVTVEVKKFVIPQTRFVGVRVSRPN
jgi:dihydroneopterin aldolase